MSTARHTHLLHGKTEHASLIPSTLSQMNKLIKFLGILTPLNANKRLHLGAGEPDEQKFKELVNQGKINVDDTTPVTIEAICEAYFQERSKTTFHTPRGQ
jgi:hypothetical protein